jgi:hypothetical protein
VSQFWDFCFHYSLLNFSDSKLKIYQNNNHNLLEKPASASFVHENSTSPGHSGKGFLFFLWPICKSDNFVQNSGSVNGWHSWLPLVSRYKCQPCILLLCMRFASINIIICKLLYFFTLEIFGLEKSYFASFLVLVSQIK